MTPTPAPAALLTGSAEAFTAASRADMQTARDAVARLEATQAPRDPQVTIQAYDAAMAALGDAAARASVCRNTHPDPALRAAAETCEQEVDALATEVSLDRALYDALAGLDAAGLDAATRHYLAKTLRDLRRAGVDRSDAVRKEVKTLRDELTRIGQEFGNNIKDDVRRLAINPAQLDGLPDDYRATHPPGPDGKVTLTTDNTDYIPFITYAKDAAAREALWRLYRLRGHPKNLDVLQRMLGSRQRLATLLGYPSWAAYATEDKMIGSAEHADQFIARIHAASEARGRRDYERLLQEKRKDDPGAAEVKPWDSAYYQERVSAAEYGFDSQTIRPYFEYRRVKDGVLAVTGRMFGLKYARRADLPVWHEDVEAYDVLESGRLVGRIYLDMHPRDGKYKHYAQFTLRSGNAEERLPEGVLVCNFPRPGEQPALMEHDGVKTLFHEFGHLLHHVLGGHTRWVGLSGVATEWDFVEAPSQMLEEWVWDATTVQSFARHHESGEPLPAALLQKARAADDFGKGLWVRQQMFYAALSLELHRRDPRGLDTTALVAELQTRYTPFRPVPDTYFHESFGHLDGYSALYYTYMWSLVIAKDLFSVFQRKGLSDVDTAREYRRAVLEPGGSQPAAELVSHFLGRPYDFTAYQQWLDAG